MAGYLTTHVLDTASGRPAAGLKIDLYQINQEGDSETRTKLKSVVTNSDGRTDGPILPTAEFAVGEYELVFHAGAYLDAAAGAGETPRFLNKVPLRFGMADETHYHVPLLVSPYSYSTYRGS